MNRKALLIFGIALLATFLIVSYLRKDEPRLQLISGYTMGTITYNVKYMGLPDQELAQDIADELKAFNQSLSTYIPDSEISRLNESGELVYESTYFYPVLKTSKKVYAATAGAFDPTVGPLVRAWGFGPEGKIPKLDSAQVDSLLQITGFDLVSFDEKTVKLPKNYQLDFSAVAKGYAVDLVSRLVEKRGVSDYMVEIGGEVRCKGNNDQGKTWALGIEDPTVKINEQKLLAIVRLKDQALATSGNYRNYFEEAGKIYAHILDPRTGYTSRHNLLSASVFASDCMTADAFATALMVVGLEPSIQIVESQEIEAVLIYQNEAGQLESYVSTGIAPFMQMNKAK